MIKKLKNDEISLLRARAPLGWLGHGMSLAICALASEICELSDIRSSYATPEGARKLTSREKVEVSASGRPLSERPILKLTSSHGSKNGNSVACKVATLNAAVTWSGIEFAMACVEWLISTFSLKVSEFHEIPLAMPSEKRSQILVLVDDHAPILKQLIFAVDGKIPCLNIRVTGVEEFGHGLHHLVWREPDKFTVLLIGGHEPQDGQRRKVQSWLAKQGVSSAQAMSAYSPASKEYLVQTFVMLLDLITERSAKLDFDTASVPIPKEIDTLR